MAQVRKQLAAQQPKRKRGRPKANQRQLVQKCQRLQQKIADLFEHRYLFVQHHLTPRLDAIITVVDAEDFAYAV